jgi:hypothetical protein
VPPAPASRRQRAPAARKSSTPTIHQTSSGDRRRPSRRSRVAISGRSAATRTASPSTRALAACCWRNVVELRVEALDLGRANLALELEAPQLAEQRALLAGEGGRLLPQFLEPFACPLREVVGVDAQYLAAARRQVDERRLLRGRSRPRRVTGHHSRRPRPSRRRLDVDVASLLASVT